MQYQHFVTILIGCQYIYFVLPRKEALQGLFWTHRSVAIVYLGSLFREIIFEVYGFKSNFKEVIDELQLNYYPGNAYYGFRQSG